MNKKIVFIAAGLCLVALAAGSFLGWQGYQKKRTLPYLIASQGIVADMEAYLNAHADFDINSISPQGRRLLSLAVDNPDYHMAEYVLHHGANPNLYDKAWPNAAPLATAVHSRRFPAAYQLLKAGANPNTAVPGTGDTPLSLAAGEDCGDTRFLKLLREKGADMHIRNARQQTVLMLALRGDPCLLTIEMLIDSGTDVNAVDALGNSVLEYALSFARETRVIQLLLNAGANAAYIDNDGLSMLDTAYQTKRCPKTLKLLYDYGARLKHYANQSEALNLIAEAVENPSSNE